MNVNQIENIKRYAKSITGAEDVDFDFIENSGDLESALFRAHEALVKRAVWTDEAGYTSLEHLDDLLQDHDGDFAHGAFAFVSRALQPLIHDETVELFADDVRQALRRYQEEQEEQEEQRGGAVSEKPAVDVTHSGVRVLVYDSDEPGVVSVQIETQVSGQRVRVMLNDGDLFEGDAEVDEHPWSKQVQAYYDEQRSTT